ncbi:MAG: L-2-amino-thiazoline-4-carboxylic acid hydrolase [Clostridia bacterium]|nr:L-2-amino-thiazoline-4-carboxylic acid hydrolase [Clostridia bacterium]
MKYAGMPQGMWLLYKNSFRKNLTAVLGFDSKTANRITKKAAVKYKHIIKKLPAFEKEDRFKMNLVNCAVLVAFLLSMGKRPAVEPLSVYYSKSMMTAPTRLFCRLEGKSKFSKKDVAAMQAAAALRAADRNPYSWNMEFYPYADGSGYEARFTKCGICALMKEYGFYELTPALCRLDYDMSKAGGASEFVREYTLAGGGPYCDCGYKRKK